MTRFVTKLLVLLAVLLMPLGMTPAAASPQHEPMALDMPMGHCPDQAPSHDMKDGIAQCTMACAGALPAVELAAQEPLTIIREHIASVAAQRLHGLHPETATPPPKPS